MEMLFDISKQGEIKITDNTFLLIPELKEVYSHARLGYKGIRWLVLVYDYNSPYRLLPLKRRKEDVTYEIFEAKEYSFLRKDPMTTAIKKYKKLQYCPITEQYNVLTDKIAQYSELIDAMDLDELNYSKIEKMLTGQSKLIAERKKIIELLTEKKEDEAQKFGGQSEISFLEERTLHE